MHDNELEIDKVLVRSLLKDQCPKWAHLPLDPIPSHGTDHSLFRLGGEYVVRLPRIDWAAKSVDKEYEWVPKISKFLKISISEPLFKGTSNKNFPWPWIVTKWNEGTNPSFEKEREYQDLAKDCAHFLNDLHGMSIKLTRGPFSRRGVSLQEVDAPTRKALDELEGEVDTESLISLWDQLLKISLWDKNPVWVHGDFLPGNILIQNDSLSAVIDFSDVGRGDPACDLIVAWSLFNEGSRELFRKSLENIDANTWERGRGWALSIGVIMLSYYRERNETLTSLARRLIGNIF